MKRRYALLSHTLETEGVRDLIRKDLTEYIKYNKSIAISTPEAAWTIDEYQTILTGLERLHRRLLAFRQFCRTGEYSSTELGILIRALDRDTQIVEVKVEQDHITIKFHCIQSRDSQAVHGRLTINQQYIDCSECENPRNCSHVVLLLWTLDIRAPKLLFGQPKRKRNGVIKPCFNYEFDASCPDTALFVGGPRLDLIKTKAMRSPVLAFWLTDDSAKLSMVKGCNSCLDDEAPCAATCKKCMGSYCTVCIGEFRRINHTQCPKCRATICKIQSLPTYFQSLIFS